MPDSVTGLPCHTTLNKNLTMSQIVGLANLAACQPGAAPAAQVSDAQAELEAARLQIAQLQAQMQVIRETPCLLSSAVESFTLSAPAVCVIVQLRKHDPKSVQNR